MAKRKDWYSLTDLARMFKDFEIVVPMDDNRVLISSQYLQINVPRSKLPIQYDAGGRHNITAPRVNGATIPSVMAVGMWDSIELGETAEPVKFNGHPVSAHTGHTGPARLFRTTNGPMMLSEKYLAFVEIGTGAVAWHVHDKNKNLLVAVNLAGEPVGLVMTMRVFDSDESDRHETELEFFDPAPTS